MPDAPFPANLTTAARALIETLALVEPTLRAVVICFDPLGLPATHSLDSNAAAVDLIPVLRAVLERLESGALRMPVSGGAVRWVDFDVAESG
jgi:hypothetical protein